MAIPLFSTRVPAGFPTPGEGEIEDKLDLNTHLIKHPAATFFVRVEGCSMEGAGIFEGDLLIVDRAITPRDGHIVLSIINGEFTVKRLRLNPGVTLEPAHPDFNPMKISEEMDFEVWGVVTHTIKSCIL